jgi:hypothetical protein
LDLGGIVQEGKTQLEKLISAAASGSRDAHIAAQNQAGADMNQISTQYNQLKSQGLMTAAMVLQYITAMQQVIQNFRDFAARVGTSRAQQGATDIAYYGGLAINDMQRDRNAMTGGTGTGPVTLPGGVVIPGTPSGLPTMSQLSQYAPIIAGALFLIFGLPALRRS